MNSFDAYRWLSGIVVICLVCLGNIQPALSQEEIQGGITPDRPLTSSNRSPLQDILAVPTAKSGHLLKTGQSLFELQVDIANNFTSAIHGGESTRIDGERVTTTFSWQRAINDNWQVGAGLPWIYDSGGFLDSLIQDWHELWGLPNGGRDLTGNNRLQYAYEFAQDAGSTVSLSRSGGGIGDLRLQAARSLYDRSDRALSLHGQIKLPTGDSKFLRSSGSTDLAVGVSFSDDKSLVENRLSYFVSGGGIWLGEADILANRRRQFMAFGNIGMAWEALTALCVKLQLDAHSAGYDSQLSELNESVQLVMGGSVRLGENWLLDIAVSEDLVVDAAQDVGFLLKLIYLHDRM